MLCRLGQLPPGDLGRPGGGSGPVRGPGKGLVRRDYQHLTPETARTAGEVLYLRHGVTGVRGQAEAGFPAVREVGLPVLEESLRQGLSWNDAGAGPSWP